MGVRTRGITLTNSFQEIPARNIGCMFEVWNETANAALILIGEQALDDANAKAIAGDDNWYTEIDISTTPVYMKGNGKVIIIADWRE